MSHRRLNQRFLVAVSTAAVLTLGVGVATASTSSSHAAKPAVSKTASAAKPKPVSHDYVAGSAVANGGAVHGIALTEANRPFDVDLSAMERLANDGVNTVNLYITEYQKGNRASTITSGAYTPSTTEVSAAIALAHSLGLAVEMTPIVWTTGTYTGRQFYNPTDLASWFSSYTKMIDGWASLAQSDGAEIFCAGTEYQHLEAYVTPWEKVFASIHKLYSGELTYMSDAGNYHNVKFWNDPYIDDISLSPYFTISKAAVPTVAASVKAWVSILGAGLKSEYDAFHKPILFGELGYDSSEGAGNIPYDVHYGPASETAQANLYQAAIEAVNSEPWIRGVVWFTWTTPSLSPSTDLGFTPQSKKAECTLAKAWSSTSALEVGGEPIACEVASLSSTL